MVSKKTRHQCWDSSQKLKVWAALQGGRRGREPRGGKGEGEAPNDESGLSPGLGMNSPIAERRRPPEKHAKRL